MELPNLESFFLPYSIYYILVTRLLHIQNNCIMPIGNPYIDNTAAEVSGEEDKEIGEEDVGHGEEPKECESSTKSIFLILNVLMWI